jgi:hypothetical protein
MRRKKLFIYTVLAAVLLSAALGIGAKTIHERIINGKEPADNHTTAPLVDVDVTKGQPDEKIKNPLPEWNHGDGVFLRHPLGDPRHRAGVRVNVDLHRISY